jgi:hypothetical protein
VEIDKSVDEHVEQQTERPPLTTNKKALI